MITNNFISIQLSLKRHQDMELNPSIPNKELKNNQQFTCAR